MTLAGIEQATFRFVAQHLNHCATAVPFPACYLHFFPEKCPHNSLPVVTLGDELLHK